MKAFLKTLPGKLLLIGLCIVLLGAMGLCGYTLWHYMQPKFQDATMELGAEMPGLDAFLTAYAQKENAAQISDAPDLSKAGVYPVEFSYNGKTHTVNITVTDTVAPTATFQDITADIDDALKPEDFVTDVYDLAETTISFANPYEKPADFGVQQIEVIVTDASGNQISRECSVAYLWIRETVTLELGDTLEMDDVLLNPKRDSQLLSQKELDHINKTGVGTYPLTISGDRAGSCTVTVQDTTPPELQVKNVSVMVGTKVKKSDFIKSCADASEKITTTVSGLPDFKTKGDYTITIEAVDPSGNKTTKTATLSITGDKKAPVFSGLSAMEVKKGASPNWKSGVKATDNVDGNVAFAVNTDKVNLSKAGTYYATYTATDAAGNKASARRKVVVSHNDEDTKALVKSTADSLSSDPLTLSKWVRSKIKYNANWGGDDPIWYGLKNKKGNCYVHAKILEALLKEKGYETKLIWVTDKSHYWNIVKIDGKWYHIDSTPGTKHPSRLMDDTDRYNNLQGRNWDRDKWPACN